LHPKQGGNFYLDLIQIASSNLKAERNILKSSRTVVTMHFMLVGILGFVKT
jgi:hypothetical protein